MTRTVLRILLTLLPAGAEVVDRLAVTVNKHVVTERQIVQDLRITAFVEQKTPDLSGAAKREEAARIVDQILILREAADNHVPLPGSEEAEKMLAPVRLQYASQPEFQAALARYRISEAELAARLLASLQALRFSQLRFRQEVDISEQDLRVYYDALARKDSTGKGLPSFEAGKERLQTLLMDERTMQALDEWLRIARAEAQIVYREAAFE